MLGCPKFSTSEMREFSDCMYYEIFYRLFDIELNTGMLQTLFYLNFLFAFLLIGGSFSAIGHIREYRKRSEKSVREYRAYKAEQKQYRNNDEEIYKSPKNSVKHLSNSNKSKGKARDSVRIDQNDIYKDK